MQIGSSRADQHAEKPPVRSGPSAQAVRRIKSTNMDLTSDAPGRAHKKAPGIQPGAIVTPFDALNKVTVALSTVTFSST